jgi:DNA adenine methylase
MTGLPLSAAVADDVTTVLGTPTLPFLKWVGGKRWMVSILEPLIAKQLRGRYFEPFGGGAAMLLHLAPTDAVLGDINRELVETFDTVRSSPEEVVRAVWRFSNTAECYYRVRAARPRTPIGRAARFIYLNKTSWGGIYRLNGHGAFNVPFGSTGRQICRKDVIVAAARTLASIELVVADFAVTMANAGAGDVVYADPPYVGRGLGRDVGFARYHFPPFRWTDQERLAESAHAAVERGATVFLTARAGVGVEELYPGWSRLELTRSQRISRRVDRRLPYMETLIASGNVGAS